VGGRNGERAWGGGGAGQEGGCGRKGEGWWVREGGGREAEGVREVGTKVWWGAAPYLHHVHEGVEAAGQVGVVLGRLPVQGKWVHCSWPRRGPSLSSPHSPCVTCVAAGFKGGWGQQWLGGALGGT
jgi:hypothetical protein